MNRWFARGVFSQAARVATSLSGHPSRRGRGRCPRRPRVPDPLGFYAFAEPSPSRPEPGAGEWDADAA